MRQPPDRSLGCWARAPTFGKALATAASVVSRICRRAEAPRQRHGQDDVGPRQQRSVNGLWEVASGNEQYVRTTIRQVVKLGKYCIGRPMHIDRIRIHAQARPVNGERLDLIE